VGATQVSAALGRPRSASAGPRNGAGRRIGPPRFSVPPRCPKASGADKTCPRATDQRRAMHAQRDGANEEICCDPVSAGLAGNAAPAVSDG